MTTPSAPDAPFGKPSGEWGPYGQNPEGAQGTSGVGPHPQTWADPQPWSESRPWAAETPTFEASGPYGNIPPYGPHQQAQPQATASNQPTPTAFQDYRPSAQPPGVQWQQPPSSALQPYPATNYPPAYAYGGVPARAPRSKVAAALLAWFFGMFGAHNFYLGNSSRAKTQLALYIVGILTAIIGIGFILMGVVHIWAFIEFIQILIGSNGFDSDADGYPLTT